MDKSSREVVPIAQSITRFKTPEEKELEKKQIELGILESELAQRELELATLQAELYLFEREYMRVIGTRYAKLDEIEAEIAELLARLKPKDVKAKKKAEEARNRANRSSKASDKSVTDQGKTKEFKPLESLKKLYREVAKTVHPDLTTDEKERKKRHKLMAEANQAYQDANEDRLQEILREWHSSPESVKGEGAGAELVRIIRKIAQIQDRLKEIKIQTKELRKSELYKLFIKVNSVDEQGVNLLERMASNLDEQINTAQNRLQALIDKGNFQK